jgi:hypothetical protein
MPIREAPERPERRSGQEAAIVAAAVAVFVGIASFKALRQPYPFFDDVDYLDLGNQIHVGSGFWGIWGDLFAGRFTHANRHPLYLALVSILARPEVGYHRDARVLAVALGALTLLSAWWVARRHFGRAPAALLAVMLAGSGALIWTASREGADTLLVIFWALAVGALLDGAGADERRRQRAWLWAGVWSGLAYLSKGPGLFLPICVALTLLWRERLRALRDVPAWLFAGAFALVSCPLWVRNLRVYGSPIYTSNDRAFWLDRLSDYAELSAPYAEARLPSGAREYFAHVAPGALAWRFGMGLGETVFHLGDSMALVAPAPGTVLHVTWVVVGGIAAGAALRFIWRWEPGFPRTFMLVHAAWWFAFLAVFNAGGGGAARYFLPLMTTTLAPALAVWFVGRDASAARPRWALGVTGAVLFAVASTLVLDRRPTTPPAGFLEVQDWLVRNLGDGEVYAVDARTHLQPRWLAPRAHPIIVSASFRDRPVPTGEMLRYLCEQRVRYVVLDGQSVTSAVEVGSANMRFLFYDQLSLGPDGALPLQGFPGGLRPVYVGKESPRRWIVLETACATAAGT